MNVLALEEAAQKQHVLLWRGQRVTISKLSIEVPLRGRTECTLLDVPVLDWKSVVSADPLVLPARPEDLTYY